MFGIGFGEFLFFGVGGTVALIWIGLAIPFANRNQLLQKYASRQPKGLKDISVSEHRLRADLNGHPLKVNIDESIHISSGSSGTSRRRVHHIEVELSLPDFPKELTLFRDDVMATFAAQHGETELNFDHPDFDNAFWVTSSDPETAREYLTPQRRTLLAYFLGRRSFRIEDGVLHYSKTRHFRYGIGTIAGTLKPAQGLSAALNGEKFSEPRPGFILRRQLRTWSIPVAILGLIGGVCVPLSANHEMIVIGAQRTSLALGLWLIIPLPGAKPLLKIWWPTVGLYATASILLMIWQSGMAWYQQLGTAAAVSLFVILLWIAWKLSLIHI